MQQRDSFNYYIICRKEKVEYYDDLSVLEAWRGEEPEDYSRKIILIQQRLTNYLTRGFACRILRDYRMADKLMYNPYKQNHSSCRLKSVVETLNEPTN